MAKMTEKQRRFAEHYIELGNAEQAALKSGYSEKYARGNAHKLVANVGIKSYIEKRMGELASKRVMGQQEALELLTSIGRGEMTEELYIPTELGLERVEKTPDIKDRQKAIDSLLKRYPMNESERLKNKMLLTQIQKLEKELQSEDSTEDKLAELIKQNREVLGHDKD